MPQAPVPGILPFGDATASAAEQSDEALLARFLRGEREALGRLAEQYEPALLGFACGALAGRRDLAMEAVQETWLRVIKYGKSFRAGSSVRTWLYRVLINACNDTRSRSQRMRLGVIAEDIPANEATDGEVYARVREAVGGLSGEHRLLVLLCYHQGMTHPQAAEVLEIPVGTLKSRLHAALGKLREKLGEPAGQDARP